MLWVRCCPPGAPKAEAGPFLWLGAAAGPCRPPSQSVGQPFPEHAVKILFALQSEVEEERGNRAVWEHTCLAQDLFNQALHKLLENQTVKSDSTTYSTTATSLFVGNSLPRAWWNCDLCLMTENNCPWALLWTGRCWPGTWVGAPLCRESKATWSSCPLCWWEQKCSLVLMFAAKPSCLCA